ncbi:MAG: carboxypeptidase-like regulatory domain-containing protein [Fibrobacterales bacterium]
MRLIYVLLFLLCLSCTVPEPEYVGNGSETTNGIIAGTLTLESGTPAIAAKVQLRDSSTTAIDSTTTNSTGYFQFSNVTPGTYSLLASDSNRSFQWFKDSVTLNDTSPSVEFIETLSSARTINFTTPTINDNIQLRISFPELGQTENFNHATAGQITIPEGTFIYELYASQSSLSDAQEVLVTIDTINPNSADSLGTIEIYTLQGDSSQVLFDDFEDSDHISNFFTPWYTFDDRATSGISAIKTFDDQPLSQPPGFNNSTNAGSITFTLIPNTTSDPVFVGLGTHLGKDYTPYLTDLSKLKSITFNHTSTKHHTITFCLISKLYNNTQLCTYPIDASLGIWASKTIPLSLFNKTPAITLIGKEAFMKGVNSFAFIMNTGTESGETTFSIDDLMFYFE